MKGSRWEYDQAASMGLGLYRILHFKTSKLGLGSVGDDKVVVDLGRRVANQKFREGVCQRYAY